MYKLAVFDLDGTLLNTLDDLAAAGNHVLSSNGFPVHTPETYKEFVGNGVRNLIKRALPLEYRCNEAILQSLLQQFSIYYTDHGEDKTQPYPGIIQLLTSLGREGIQLAVLSNKPDQYVPELVKHYFPGLIDLAYGQRKHIPMKPAPDGLFEIMKYFHCEHKKCVYIGDSDVDMYTGAAASIFTVGVTWGFRTQEELRSAGASAIVHSATELYHLLVDNNRPLCYTKGVN